MKKQRSKQPDESDEYEEVSEGDEKEDWEEGDSDEESDEDEEYDSEGEESDGNRLQADQRQKKLIKPKTRHQRLSSKMFN